MIQARSYKELIEHTDCKDKEMGCVEVKDNKYKIYTFNAEKKKWETVKNELAVMSVYDLNKQIVKQKEDYVFTGKESKLINEYVNSYPDKYFMLLCNDLHYFTLFRRVDEPLVSLGKEVIDILKSNTLGTVKSIDIIIDKNNPNLKTCEIWTVLDDEPHVSYLFNYDLGVIECN